MDQSPAERSAFRVGAITLFIGIALVAAPSRFSRLLRTGDHPAALRAIGISDLLLVPGLLFGQRRARWMAARAVLNLLIAAYCVRLVRREGVIGAKVGAGAMVLATIADGQTIIALRDLKET